MNSKLKICGIDFTQKEGISKEGSRQSNISKKAKSSKADSQNEKMNTKIRTLTDEFSLFKDSITKSIQNLEKKMEELIKMPKNNNNNNNGNNNINNNAKVIINNI